MTEEAREKYTAFHIANYFLWRAWKEGVEITTLKLIKLVYIAYGWNFAITGKKLFDEGIFAWKYGPVIPSIYHYFKRFGSDPIKKNCYAAKFKADGQLDDVPAIPAKEKDILKILNAEWIKYKELNGVELSNITHARGGAWDTAYHDNCENYRMDNDETILGLIKERSMVGINEYLKTIN